MSEHDRLDDAAPLVALLQDRPRGVSVSAIRDAALELGNTHRVWEALAKAPPSLLGAPEAVAEARQQIEAWAAAGITTASILSSAYPERVRTVWEAPPVLFHRGHLKQGDLGVSVVGSREASAAGLRMAEQIAGTLVTADLTVVSGLAKGVDTAAHRAALDAGGRTVAFVATGLDHVYPAANRGLHEDIIRAAGAIVSEYLPPATPRKHTFLQRNALMSGYGLATVVVEAGEKSGARAQARMAVEHGRPVILTSRVVDSTEWAKALLGRPHVAVATSAAEVALLLQHLRSRRRTVDDAVRQLLRA